jgi:hypothetical protein
MLSSIHLKQHEFREHQENKANLNRLSQTFANMV